MILAGDELEFAISQYLDGQLSAIDAGVLEERLATDSAARELMREYEQVQGTLRSTPRLPELNWDALSRETAQHCAAEWKTIHGKSNVFLRFLQGNRDSASIGRLGIFAPLSLAASLLIVGGVALMISRSPTTPTASSVLVQTSGPSVETATGQVVAQVSIGAAPTVAVSNYRNTDDVINRPSIVLIDRADNPAPDSDSLY